jgi:hypothetical protein
LPIALCGKFRRSCIAMSVSAMVRTAKASLQLVDDRKWRWLAGKALATEEAMQLTRTPNAPEHRLSCDKEFAAVARRSGPRAPDAGFNPRAFSLKRAPAQLVDLIAVGVLQLGVIPPGCAA